MTTLILRRLFQLDGLVKTLKRFPLPVLAALFFTSVTILDEQLLWHVDNSLNLLTFGAYTSFFVLLALKLVGEVRGWPRQITLLASAFGVLGVAAWNLSAGVNLGVPHLLIGAAGFGFCVIAPTLGKKPLSEDFFWKFVQQSLTGLFIVTASMIVLFLGILILDQASNILFGASLQDKEIGIIGLIITSVATPVYALSLIPQLSQDASEKAPDRLALPKSLIFLLSVIATPLLLIYGLMILFYGIRVLAFNTPPIASVSWLVMGYATMGIATHLMSYPLRDNGPAPLRFFRSVFYPSLLPLLALLFWAGFLRISAYGLTEMRYLLMLGAIWALGLALWTLAMPRRVKLWHGPLTLVLLLICASFGPWGAENTSLKSQTARLTQLMEKYHLTAPPHLTQANISWSDQKELSGLLDYFSGHRLNYVPDIIKPAFVWVDPKYQEETRTIRSGIPYEIMKGWGLTYVSEWEKESSTIDTTFKTKQAGNFQNQEAVYVTGFDLMLRLTYISSNCATTSQPTWPSENLNLCQENGQIILSDSLNKVAIDLLPHLPLEAHHKLTSGTTMLAAPLAIEGHLGRRHYKFLLSELSFMQNIPTTDPNHYQISDIKGTLLIQKTP